MSTVDGAADEARRALAWLARVEQDQPRHRSGPQPGRWFSDTGRVMVADSLEAAARRRAAMLFVDRATEGSLLDADAVARHHERVAADVVMLGARRETGRLRLRAFSLGRSPRTVAVQQRQVPDIPTALLTGAAVQRSVRRIWHFTVPTVFGSGTVEVGPGVMVDWVSEGVVAGTVITSRLTDEAVREILGRLGVGWQRERLLRRTRHRPLRPNQRVQALAGLITLADDPPAGAWPDDVAPGPLVDRVRRLLATAEPMTTGLVHGDPVVGNTLRTRTGGLALLDWEFATTGQLSHDAAKALRSAVDPLSLIDTAVLPRTLQSMIRRTGALAWPRQIAVSLLVFTGQWADRHTRAVARGRGRRSAQALATGIRLIDALTT